MRVVITKDGISARGMARVAVRDVGLLRQQEFSSRTLSGCPVVLTVLEDTEVLAVRAAKKTIAENGWKLVPWT